MVPLAMMPKIEVDVEVAAQTIALDLSTQLHFDGRQHACHPDTYAGVVTVGDRHFVRGKEQGGVAILIGLDAFQFHISHTHRAVFALKYEVLQCNVIQSAIFSDGEDGALFGSHIVYGDCDGHVVISCIGSDSRYANE